MQVYAKERHHPFHETATWMTDICIFRTEENYAAALPDGEILNYIKLK